VSYEFSNEIVLHDPKESFLKFIDYNPKKTPKRVKSLNGISLTSKEQMQKEFQSYLEQVKFYPPVWDDLNKQYLRLSTTRIFHELDDDQVLIPKNKEIKVYLSVFDREFNLLNELEIPELSYTHGKYFAINGKLWIFINLDDEMGFVRISLSE
jgi:Lhr-like helicase